MRAHWKIVDVEFHVESSLEDCRWYWWYKKAILQWELTRGLPLRPIISKEKMVLRWEVIRDGFVREENNEIDNVWGEEEVWWMASQDWQRAMRLSGNALWVGSCEIRLKLSLNLIQI